MKLCILLNDITSGGGVERVVCNTSNYFYKKLGYNIDILSIFENQDSYIKYRLDESIKVNYITKDKVFRNKYAKYKYIYHECKHIFENNDYDIVIGCSITLNIISLVWKKLSRNKKTKLIAWEHSQYEHTTKLLNIARKYMYKMLDGIITLTEADSMYFNSNIYKNVRCIYNIKSFESENTSSLASKNIISVGRLEKEKGFDMLIDAFKIAREKSDVCKKWSINIYGEGSEEKTLLQKIKRYNLEESIRINKFTSNIKDKYIESSIFVMSSRSESFGMVIIEAMNCGLPCISFACKNGPAEIISHGKDGFLVNPNDIDGLANKIVELAENYEMRKQFGKNAINKSNKFSSENILKEWSVYFDEVKST